jgi:hypothetical protein
MAAQASGYTTSAHRAGGGVRRISRPEHLDYRLPDKVNNQRNEAESGE